MHYLEFQFALKMVENIFLLPPFCQICYILFLYLGLKEVPFKKILSFHFMHIFTGAGWYLNFRLHIFLFKSCKCVLHFIPISPDLFQASNQLRTFLSLSMALSLNMNALVYCFRCCAYFPKSWKKASKMYLSVNISIPNFDREIMEWTLW